MRTLHLNLKKKWFDMILSCEKKEEYRAISPYFCEKFLLVNGNKKTRKYWMNYFLFCDNIITPKSLDKLKYDLSTWFIKYEDFDSIVFSNGMTPPVPRFELLFAGIEIKEGIEKWGAESGVEYFTLGLLN